MKKLLQKELTLSVHPTMYLFLALSAMLLIPQYPYYVVFLYTCLAVFFTFLTGRETHDIYYTALLPIRKSDVVRARVLTVVLLQMAQVLISVPFAILSVAINPIGNNAAGIEANVAFFGLVFLMLGGFNLLFLPTFYKTAHNLSGALIKSGIYIFVYIIVAESIAQYIPSPVSAYLDTAEPAAQLAQLPVLFGGIALYVLFTLLASRISKRRFESVDL